MQFHSKSVKMELSDSTVGEKYKRMGLDLQMNVKSPYDSAHSKRGRIDRASKVALLN